MTLESIIALSVTALGSGGIGGMVTKYILEKRMNNSKTQKIDLENIKLDILDKPIEFPSVLKSRPDQVDDIISLFKGNLPPKIPIINIAVAISDLLKIFDIYIEYPAILRRIERSETEITS